jgi:type IV pilus assembly protein PilN
VATNFNLLPWREQQRRRQRQQFLLIISLAVAIPILILSAVHFYIQHQVQHQNDRNQYLNDEIQLLDQKIGMMNQVQKDRQRLIARIDSIEQLYAWRAASVHLFDELAKTLPNGVYLTHIQQKNGHIRLQGKTQSTTHISEYLNRLKQSTWLLSANLNSISTPKQTIQQWRDFDLQVIQATKAATYPLTSGQP